VKKVKEASECAETITSKKESSATFLQKSESPRIILCDRSARWYRPTKKPVTMRLDSDVIAWLKADGRGYQTKANGLLRHAMLHFTREKGLSKPEGFRRKTAQQKGKA
jgi:uncharacterized protein (DUF4415 family)